MVQNFDSSLVVHSRNADEYIVSVFTLTESQMDAFWEYMRENYSDNMVKEYNL